MSVNRENHSVKKLFMLLLLLINALVAKIGFIINQEYYWLLVITLPLLLLSLLKPAKRKLRPRRQYLNPDELYFKNETGIPV